MQQHFHYGQVVVGPCGSGKTTYCNGIQQYLQLLGRNAVVVNFDPANNDLIDQSNNEDSVDDGRTTTNDNVKDSQKGNTALPYTAIYDVCVDAVNLKSVMKQMNLGPNGALIYCMEYMELHADEIIDTILSRTQQQLKNDNHGVYYIFDFPGQIELYTHSTCVQSLLLQLSTRLRTKLVVVQLIDALYCTDVTKFISAALLGTTTMIRLELPTVNVLSKVDLLSSYGTQSSSLPLQLDYFTECCDLERLIPFLHQSHDDEYIIDDPSTTGMVVEDQNGDDNCCYYDIMDDPDYQRIVQKRRTSQFNIRYERLHRVLAEIVDDYSLVSFIPLDINDAKSVGRVLAKIDKCNGYVFTPPSSSSSSSSLAATTVHHPHQKATANDQYHQDLFQCAIQTDGHNVYESFADIRERMASPESIRELRNNNNWKKKT